MAERELQHKPATKLASAPPVSTTEPGDQLTFSDVGPLPPVVTGASSARASASDRAYGATATSEVGPDTVEQLMAKAGGDPEKFGGLLAKKIIKKEDPKARSTIFTTHHEVLEVATSVAATDLAIPADYKEKK